MRRETAIERLAELVNRARIWLDNVDTMLLGIKRLTLFGSLAAGHDGCGDIDLLWTPSKTQVQLLRQQLSEADWKDRASRYEDFRAQLGLSRPRRDAGLIGLVMHDLRRYLTGGYSRYQLIETYTPWNHLIGWPAWITLITNNQIRWRPSTELPEPQRLPTGRHVKMLTRHHPSFFPESGLSEEAALRTLTYMPSAVRYGLLRQRPDLYRLWVRRKS